MADGARRSALTPSERRQVARRYQRGYVSLRDLARLYGCSTKPIVAALKRYNVPRRPTNNPAGRPREVA